MLSNNPQKAKGKLGFEESTTLDELTIMMVDEAPEVVRGGLNKVLA